MKRLLANTAVAASTGLFLCSAVVYLLSFIYQPLWILGAEFDFVRPVVHADRGWLICYRDPPFGSDPTNSGQPLVTHLSLWAPMILFALPLFFTAAWDLQNGRKTSQAPVTVCRVIAKRVAVTASILLFLATLLTCGLWAYCCTLDEFTNIAIAREAKQQSRYAFFEINMLNRQLNLFAGTIRELRTGEIDKLLPRDVTDAYDGVTPLRADQYRFGIQGWRLQYTILIRAKNNEVYSQYWLQLPFYLIILALMIFPTSHLLWWWRQERKARKAAAGFCPQCGYDLRASPEKCPECGRKRENKPVP